MSLRPQKRSVSPFGFAAPEEDPLAPLRDVFKDRFPSVEGKIPSELKSLHDAPFIPRLIEKLSLAPANDAPQLDNLCQFLLRFRMVWEEKGLAEVVAGAMLWLFDRKTELFMIDHQDRAHLEKLGLPDEYRNVVLFARERDALVGRYFAPLTESQPGIFSEFVTAWTDSDNPDRVLHFLDFCAGSKNPTFEHYLLFTHPALHRVVGNKSHLKALFDQAAGPISKLPSPTWEQDVRKALGI